MAYTEEFSSLNWIPHVGKFWLVTAYQWYLQHGSKVYVEPNLFFTDVLDKGLIPPPVTFCFICATGEIQLPVLKTRQEKRKSPHEDKVTKSFAFTYTLKKKKHMHLCEA